ncbi:MAG: hypothetical protein ACJ75Z_11965 [Solirubrobacterales bacterium]
MRAGSVAKPGRLGLLAVAIMVAALGFASVHPPAAQAARGMELGLYDPEFGAGDAATQTVAFDRSVEARAGIVLVYVRWDGVAPSSRPAGFVPTNPADPAYNWASTDAAVQDATARGLKVLLAFTGAPLWAEGPGRPPVADAPAGTWKPNPADVGDFARALATRYSGHFMGLPAVRYWQLWAEPNLGLNLDPQFDGGRAVGFDVYRPMLNAFYANLKSVSTQNVVVTGGTAPYGNLTPAGTLAFQRMQPLAFWRGLLCLRTGTKRKKKGGTRSQRKLIPLPCPNPAHFDIASHHPINVGAPTRRALNADDVSTPDLGKLKRVLGAAARSGRVVPGGGKPLWATEIWWNSNPPRQGGLPLARHARYLEQAFYVLWKQGVQASFWFEVRDAQGSPGQAVGGLPVPTTGLFLRDGTPKPALTAFQFPFVTERLSRDRVRAWGEAPGPGPVSIEIRRGHRYRHLRTIKAGSNRVFVGNLRLARKAQLRARQGSATSLLWKQG